MLRGNPNVFHYTTFTTADRLFAQHPIWQQAKIEAERKLIFEEYVGELKQREVVRPLISYDYVHIAYPLYSKRVVQRVPAASPR